MDIDSIDSLGITNKKVTLEKVNMYPKVINANFQGCLEEGQIQGGKNQGIIVVILFYQIRA